MKREKTMRTTHHKLRTYVSRVTPVVVAMSAMSTTYVHAATKCGGVDTTFINCNSSNNPIIAAMLVLINFIAVGVGLAVVGGIIWGGFLYTQANGSSQKTQEAVRTIVNSIIGLLVFIFMYALVNWLVPGGLFN